MHALHVTDVDETGEEYNGQRRAVILNELAHIALEEIAAADDSACVTGHKHE